MFETIFRIFFGLVLKLFRGKRLGERIPILSKMFLFFCSKLCNGKIYVKFDNLNFCWISTPQSVFEYLDCNTYEPFVSSLFRSMVKEGMTVADIGAGFGYYTLLGSQLVGETGLMLAFEPDPLCYEVLMENIKINKLRNVRPFQLAVSDSIGERKMGSGISSGFGDKDNHIITVKTVPLDSFLDINEVDLIKMDIEGAELEALRGMKKILAKGKSKIICEYHQNKLLSLGYKTEDIVSILKQYNYDIYMISERGLILKNTLSNKPAHYLFSKEVNHVKSVKT